MNKKPIIPLTLVTAVESKLPLLLFFVWKYPLHCKMATKQKQIVKMKLFGFRRVGLLVIHA